MPLRPLGLRPLTGATLQLSLLVPFLLLVIVFMAGPAGPPPQWRGRLTLPSAPHASIRETSDDAVEISINEDGMVFVESHWCPASEFPAKMAAFAARKPPARVLIRADQSVPFKTIRSALHGARLAGVNRVLLVTFEGSAFSLIFNGAT
jgi:biopolymer transport protein ExbD